MAGLLAGITYQLPPLSPHIYHALSLQCIDCSVNTTCRPHGSCRTLGGGVRHCASSFPRRPHILLRLTNGVRHPWRDLRPRYRYRQGVLPRTEGRRTRTNQLGGPRPAQEPANTQDSGDRADGLVCGGRLARAIRNRGNTRRARAPQLQGCDGTLEFAVLVHRATPLCLRENFKLVFRFTVESISIWTTNC